MSTQLKHTMITHTAPIQAALDDLRPAHPELSDSELLMLLIEKGHQSNEEQKAIRVAERRAAVLAGAGTFPNAYGPGYLDDVRGRWAS